MPPVRGPRTDHRTSLHVCLVSDGDDGSDALRTGGCPYCAKVKAKLADLDLEYESVMVPRSHGKRTEVEEISGQTGVPVLVDEEHGIDAMPESDDIVEYLEETYGDAS